MTDYLHCCSNTHLLVKIKQLSLVDLIIPTVIVFFFIFSCLKSHICISNICRWKKTNKCKFMVLPLLVNEVPASILLLWRNAATRTWAPSACEAEYCLAPTNDKPWPRLWRLAQYEVRHCRSLPLFGCLQCISAIFDHQNNETYWNCTSLLYLQCQQCLLTKCKNKIGVVRFLMNSNTVVEQPQPVLMYFCLMNFDSKLTAFLISKFYP